MPESSKPSRRVTLRRALGDLLRPSRAQLLLAVVLCLAAMGTVWQVRASHEDETYSSLRRDELVALLDQLNKSNDDLRQDIAEQEELRRQHASGVANQRVAKQQTDKRIQDLRILAGTAEGPGVVITITDPNGKVTPQLLLDGVEEMRDAGAEVIELNGVRVVASTAFGGSSTRVTVDGTPIAPPYTLKVIGEPHALAQGARFRGGLQSRAEAPDVGAAVTITEKDTVLITALHTPKDPEFAKPA